MSLKKTVECCECALPIGDDGAMRAVLLLPCQHLLHMGCVDYIRKHKKLQELAVSTGAGVGDWGDKSGSSSNCGGGGNVVVCPGCQSFIHRLVPLYISGVDGQRAPGSICTDVISQFKRLHHGQKVNITLLRALHEQRERLTQLTRTCALLHERRASAQMVMDRMSEILPSIAPAAGASRLAGDDLCVDGMTATELELYITHSSAVLSSLDREVSEQRRIADKKRKKIEELRLRFRAMMMSMGEDERGEREHRYSQRRAAVASADDMESSCSEAEYESFRGRKRHRAPPVVDVDVEESCAIEQVMIVSSRSSSDAGNTVGGYGQSTTNDVGRADNANHEGNENNNNDDDDDDDVIFVGQSRASVPSVNGIEGSTRKDNRNSGENVPVQDQRLGAEGMGISAAEEDDEEMVCYNHLQWALPTLHRVIHTPNATRLLPRRIDRLWQPSLNDLL